MTLPIILGSTSTARKALLARLPITFSVASPAIDETPHPDETPRALVERLAIEKARAIALKFPDALIIGADTVGVLHGELLNKPIEHEAAVKQLQQMSGNTVQFYTGLCLLNAQTQEHQACVEQFDVSFRTLTLPIIENYLRLEAATHCAGSFQAEGLGIALVNRFSGNDYTALIGLPLIRLVEMLEQAGVEVLPHSC